MPGHCTGRKDGITMKLSECNAKQKKAFINIAHCANWIIGGLENTIQDNLESSDEYQQAKATLADHDGLVALIYESAISEVYGDGIACFNASAKSYLKDIRFCGKEWLVARCEARVKKCGY